MRRRGRRAHRRWGRAIGAPREGLYHDTCILQVTGIESAPTITCKMQVTHPEEPPMLPAAQALIAELDAEAPVTRRVLERLPADRFGWQPHPKSFTAGQLAQHIAAIPATSVRMAQLDGVDMAGRVVEYASAEGREALLATFDASVAAARDYLGGLDETTAHARWRMTFGDREVVSFPRLAMMRTMCLNH